VTRECDDARMDGVRALNDDDDAFERWFGPSAPLTPDEVADLMAGVPARWWIVGGWAIDAFTRRPRPHHDIDVGFFGCDLPAMLDHLGQTLCVWSNASGTLRPLLHHDDLLPDCRQLWVRRDGASPWLMDLAMTPGDSKTWISPRDETLRVPLAAAMFEAPDGLRYLAPEIVLSFKARAHRPQDEADFDAVLPLLDEAKRLWLRAAIERNQPQDPWLDRLT
jgi:hypothetical protein